MEVNNENFSDSTALETFFRERGWAVRHKDVREEQQASYVQHEALSLSSASKDALSPFPNGIYEHQYEAIRTYLEGANVAITTSTASGKTLIFNVCALEVLQRDPKARIAAIYPLTGR